MSTVKTTNLKTLDDALNIPLTSIALKSELNATTISVTPTGGITETNVQAALAGLDTRVLARQPLDATLTALAGVTTSANTLIYSTGADAFAITSLTAFARTLLDDPDAVTMRSTLGAEQGLGSGQSWQNLSGSRAPGTVYTNSTGRPIAVSVVATAASGAATVTLIVAGVTVTSMAIPATGGPSIPISTIVPTGATYQVTVGAGTTLGTWVELR